MQFRFEQRVPAAPAAVFAFFADPGNLAVLHRDDRAFRLLRHSGAVAPGNTVWFELRVARVLPVVLGFEQQAWEPPHWFAEQMVHGPFARFTHRHEFEPRADGTLVRDLLDLRLPRVYGGERALRCVVAPGLRRRFQLRQDSLARIFSKGSP